MARVPGFGWRHVALLAACCTTYRAPVRAQTTLVPIPACRDMTDCAAWIPGRDSRSSTYVPYEGTVYPSGHDALVWEEAFPRALQWWLNAKPAQVMVIGSLHLRQLNPDSTPVAVELIRRQIARFKPDQVVVEWLHPSIDGASTFNYGSLGDLPTLGRLWGYRANSWAVMRDSLAETTRRLSDAKTMASVVAAARVELGKLYYLNRDEANAAYQWWLAQRLGADVRDLRRLSRNNLEGTETAEFGFWTAAQQRLERVTPFDYQGPDAGSDVWGEMLDSLAQVALYTVNRRSPRDREWAAAVDSFHTQRERFESGQDSLWYRQYGALPEVQQYLTALSGWGRANTLLPSVRDGVSQMHWLQSPEYEAAERSGQLDALPKLTFGNFGNRRLEGLRQRNEHMAAFLDADARQFSSRRILVIVGSAHKFFLEDILRRRGYTIVPSSAYVP